MSHTWIQHQPGCTGKRRYPTYEDAKSVAERFGQRVYRCPICREHHITSDDLGRRNAADRRARRSRK